MIELERSFYLRDTVTVAKELIGKYLVHEVEGKRLICQITETEAYTGILDKACHAFGDKKTPRTQALYLNGGHAYVFLIYGMYYCMNIVTESAGTPCAVLLRGAKPISEIDTIAKLRFQKPYAHLTKIQQKNLLNGPGKLCIGMNITKEDNKKDLLSKPFQLYDSQTEPLFEIKTSPRINIDYAQEYALKPWRFYI